MKILDNLIEELARLPGIGAKTAERLAYHLLKVPAEETLALAGAIGRLRESVRECSRCFNVTEQEICAICSDHGRDATLVCVVEQPKDVHAIEQAGGYRGLYHVLGGNFSPLQNRGADQLHLEALAGRVREEGIREVILATNPDFEGDGTALWVAETLAPLGVPVTRLARGVPTGSHLEYMNRNIIADALEGRTAFGPAGEELNA